VTPAAAWIGAPDRHQAAAGQVHDVERFARRHGYEVTLRYEAATPRENDRREYQFGLDRALADAHAGKYQVLVVQSLDLIVRSDEDGAESALRAIRLFRQAGVTVVSVQEPWLNGDRQVQDALAAFAGWAADREHTRKSGTSERIRAGLARRRAEGKPVGRQPGAADKKKRKRAGYVASWEDGARRAAHEAGMNSGASVPDAPPSEGADR
jgi:DNA invertase Pin-like site-specific DNA recombinase